jgi:NAD kinase
MLVLNDLVVDRGPSPFLSQLELYGNKAHLTTVQADGLVIATPTGSTAYSLSAGGSVVHPDVSAILVTPICPHTLSFRPMILPDTMEIRVLVPSDSRATAWVSFDGRHRVHLKAGDSIQIVSSQYPIPTLCKVEQSEDWFHGLERCLAWNTRERQKPLEY